MKKTKKSKTLKRIFSILACMLVLFGCFSVSAFAYVAEGETEGIEAGNEVVNGLSGSSVDYSLNSENQSFKVQINSKAQGVFGVRTSIFDLVNSIPTPYRIEFSIEYPEEYIRNRLSPRFYVWFGYQNNTAIGYSIGFIDTGISTAIINSYTLDYNTSHITNLGDNYTYDLDYYWRFYIDVDPSSGTSSLYFAPEGITPIFLNSWESIENFENGMFGLGMFDAWSASNKPIGLYAPSITNLGLGYAKGFAEGLIRGEEIGFDKGYEVGKDEGIDIGYKDGKDDGLEIGYSDGYRDGSDSAGGYIDIPLIFDSLFSGTSSILGGFLDWEIFGINVLGVLVSILVVVIVVFIVKKLRS